MVNGDPSLHITQQQLWDLQHAHRGANDGLEGEALVDVPNELALILGGRLLRGSAIFEIGSANGRDARYWAARENHSVLALDFSQVALNQLDVLAEQQGLNDRITTKLFDANTDPLPAGINTFDAFYARSALHVNGDRLNYLLQAIHGALHDGGLLAIEGKHDDDPKIQRSVIRDSADRFLVSDPFENGHVRRAWNPDQATRMLKNVGFVLTELEVIEDTTVPGETAIFTRIMASKE